MSTVAGRPPWVAQLLFAATLLFSLAPLLAGAHSGRDPGGESASLAADSRATAHRGHGAASLASGWSRSCPGGRRNTCCCGGFLACTVSGKTPIVNTGGWMVPVPTLAGRETPPFVLAAPLSALPPSPVLPRAPPLSS